MFISRFTLLLQGSKERRHYLRTSVTTKNNTVPKLHPQTVSPCCEVYEASIRLSSVSRPTYLINFNHHKRLTLANDELLIHHSVQRRFRGP